MSFEAYLNPGKTKKVDARKVGEEDRALFPYKTFYCTTPGCNAEMSFRPGTERYRPHFASRCAADHADHCSVPCIKANPEDYNTKDFVFRNFVSFILQPTDDNKGTSHPSEPKDNSGKPQITTLRTYHSVLKCLPLNDYLGGKSAEETLIDPRSLHYHYTNDFIVNNMVEGHPSRFSNPRLTEAEIEEIKKDPDHYRRLEYMPSWHLTVGSGEETISFQVFFDEKRRSIFQALTDKFVMGKGKPIRRDALVVVMGRWYRVPGKSHSYYTVVKSKRQIFILR